MIPDLRNTKESPGHSPVICRKMAGIVCFLLKIHPCRQRIRCLPLLFLGRDGGCAIALLCTVTAEPGMTAAVNDSFGGVLWEIYFISIFHSHCSRCRSTCCRRSRSLRGNEAHRDLPAGWGSPSRPRGQNEWACPENSCRIYKPFGFAATCWAGGSACRP